MPYDPRKFLVAAALGVLVNWPVRSQVGEFASARDAPSLLPLFRHQASRLAGEIRRLTASDKCNDGVWTEAARIGSNARTSASLHSGLLQSYAYFLAMDIHFSVSNAAIDVGCLDRAEGILGRVLAEHPASQPDFADIRLRAEIGLARVGNARRRDVRPRRISPNLHGMDL